MTKTDRRTFLTKAGLLSLTAISGTALLQACAGGEAEAETSASPRPKPAPPSPVPEEKTSSAAIDECAELNANLKESDLSVRQSVGYVLESPEAEKICKNCRFYQADKFEGSCGGCMLFVNGAVVPGAYCNSWAAEV